MRKIGVHVMVTKSDGQEVSEYTETGFFEEWDNVLHRILQQLGVETDAVNANDALIAKRVQIWLYPKDG